MKADAPIQGSMRAVVYVENGRFEVRERPKPGVVDPGDVVVRVTTASICTSDLHIRAGAVPRAVPGITVGHEFVGVVESVGSGVERFSSLTTQGKYLSLSFWDSEKAASCWRNHVLHRAAQLEGRTALFADYKITVAVVQRAYTAENRTQAPADSSDFFQS